MLLFMTALFLVAPALAQDLRPDETFFIKPRVGVSSYLGDNEKSPSNLNFDMYKIDGKLPFNIAIELGYQFSVPFSLSLAYQLGNYPIITQFGEEEGNEAGIDNDPTTRSTIQLFGRYTFANARTRVAPYLDFGIGYSFGDVAQQQNGQRTGTEESGSAFGLVGGIGLDFALNDRTSFFIESVSTLHFGDAELDANDQNGFGSTDLLTGIGLGLKINFKRAFTPVEVYSATCPSQRLTVGQTGSFTASVNDAVASPPLSYLWDFGDGSTASGLTVSHSYATAGSYTVTFTATNSGSTDTGTCTVSVIAPAEIVTITANKTTVSICDADPSIRFSANVRGDAPLSYRWDFGDGQTSGDTSPSHTYASVGTYTVTLTLTNSGGTDTRTMTVTVSDAGCFNCDISQMNSVFFDRNSSVLTEQARSQLMENVEIFRNCPNLNGRLEGYASRDERNVQRLSEDRARAVEQFYIQNGIAASRLTAVGMGATGQTTKKGGADQFRRVDTIPVAN
jgi:outer membrane protein OmpA-like peptidoglycan-associated protein/outer membrane protein W